MSNLHSNSSDSRTQPSDCRQACSPPHESARRVTWVLRGLGSIDLGAAVAVVMPRSWIAAAHAWVGLGEFPDEPIAGYLARSASALYALHGLLVIYMSRDVERYWGLIRFFALAAVLHGLVMFSIDVREGMPLWWILLEGPIFAVTGLGVLAVQMATRPESS